MKKALCILLACLFILTSGCAFSAPKPSATPAPASEPTRGAVERISFTDAVGHDVEVSETDRVVAASGSFAQLWLLSGGTLIGTTEDALSYGLELPADIASVGSLHGISLESLIALEPQLVILSADISAHTAMYEQLTDAGIPVAYFSVEVFEDYLAALKIFTDINGRPDLYEENGLRLQSEINDIIARAQGKPSPSVLLLRAGAGKVVARNSDTMAGAMLRDMGCVNIADRDNGLLDNLSMEVILQEDPDYIFVVTMGESEEKAQQALEETLLSNPAWAGLTAVKNGHYISLPKALFHLKPNNRWNEAYGLLWDTLYAGS
ncbi:Vitamin B12-binding protein [bioreactor metagenome]|uniref:Vitamin B12-binding protein n=1 Tax=bioreactor metagenome TaxID=1076179 RepID=A0A645CKW8_9ZZZZ